MGGPLYKGDVGHGGAEPRVQAGIPAAEVAVQGGVGGIEGADRLTLVAFLGQQFAHQGPGGAPALGTRGEQ
jgi:hypothetical protein